MLRYLDNSEDVEGGYHRIARTIGGAGTIRYSIQHEAQQARNENGQKKSLRSVGKKKKSYVLPAGPDVMRSGKA